MAGVTPCAKDLFKVPTSINHKLERLTLRHVILKRQHTLEPFSVLCVLTYYRPYSRLLQVSTCYWLNGDCTRFVLYGFSVHGCALQGTVWPVYLEAEVAHCVYSDVIFCLAFDLHKKRKLKDKTEERSFLVNARRNQRQLSLRMQE